MVGKRLDFLPGSTNHLCWSVFELGSSFLVYLHSKEQHVLVISLYSLSGIRFCSWKMTLKGSEPLHLSLRKAPFPPNPFSNQGEKNTGTGLLKARIPEWDWVRKDLGDRLVPALSMGRESSTIPSHVQPGLGHFQGWATCARLVEV